MKITATYSVEDNKLRLYAEEYIPRELFLRIKYAGFRWAPVQKLFVAPKWTPGREDMCVELAGEIEQEESTLVERAEAKAERLSGLASRNAQKSDAYFKAAQDYSARFAGGQPILMGHHSQHSAERDRDRANAAMEKSVKARDAIEYWNYKLEGVEAHAEYHNDPEVRRRRIDTLLKGLREHQRTQNTCSKAVWFWQQDLSDDLIKSHAKSWHFGASELQRERLKVGEDPQEVKKDIVSYWEANVSNPYRRRWINHYLGRLSYERSELGDVKSFTGELTPVILQKFARTFGTEKPKATKTALGFRLESPVSLPLMISNKESTELSNQGWVDLMQSCGYEVPAPKPRRKSNVTHASLINPTMKEAQRLQDLWNNRIVKALENDKYRTAKISEVLILNQGDYAAHSKGSYAHYKTIELDETGTRVTEQWRDGEYKKFAKPVCRIRISTRSVYTDQAPHVIHIVDKPTKELPI